MKHESESLSFNYLIPLELFREIQLFSGETDYYGLVSSMKLFADIKFQTRIIRLKSDDAIKFLGDLEFRPLILGKVANTGRQLCVYLNAFPEYVLSSDLLSDTPLLKLDLTRCRPNVGQHHLWESFLSKKQDVRIGYGISCAVFPQFESLQQVFIRENSSLTDISSLAHLKKVHLVGCYALSNISSLKNAKYIRIEFCNAIVDVSLLGKISRLQFFNCNGITDVSALTNNDHLYLDQCIHIQKFPSQFNGRQFFHHNPTVLHKIVCPNLRFYELSTRSTVLDILCGLELRFPKLFSVEISYCDAIYNVDGLKKIPVVVINSCAELQDISGLGGNKSVFIKYSNKITSFASLRNVHKVMISYCPGFSNGHDVENVKDLTLAHLPEFKDPRMLANVRHLIINGRMDSFQGLGNVPDLEVDFVLKEVKHLGGPEQKRIVLKGIHHSYLDVWSPMLSICSDYDRFDGHDAAILLRKREVGPVQNRIFSSLRNHKCNIM
jgi:hypothetical protein